MRYVLAVIGGLAAFVVLGFVIQGTDFFLYRTFAPKYEQVRRETFEQTKSYRQGMAQELENMRFQYEQADDAHRDALADLILHRAADVDPYSLSPELASFISNLRRERAARR